MRNKTNDWYALSRTFWCQPYPFFADLRAPISLKWKLQKRLLHKQTVSLHVNVETRGQTQYFDPCSKKLGSVDHKDSMMSKPMIQSSGSALFSDIITVKRFSYLSRLKKTERPSHHQASSYPVEHCASCTSSALINDSSYSIFYLPLFGSFTPDSRPISSPNLFLQTRFRAL